MAEMCDDAGLVIVGGGSGSRFGGDKLLADLNGMPLFCVTLQRLAPVFPADCRVMAVPGDKIALYEEIAARFLLSVSCRFVAAGAVRSESVQCGLAALPEKCRYAAIHDAARPLADAELVRTVLAAARRTGGAVPASPVVDTLKLEQDGMIAGTVDRERLRAVSTPQCFDLARLREAYRRAGEVPATDDAAIMERAGFPVELVPWFRPNPKVTYAGDLPLAAFYLQEERRSAENGAVVESAD